MTNLKTARMLGLTVPPTPLARADEMIEQECFCCGALVRFWHETDKPSQSLTSCAVRK